MARASSRGLVADLRSAFLTSLYGPTTERAQLSSGQGEAPTWASGTWAIVTAWNPGGERQAPLLNHQAGESLLAVVKQAGLEPLPALNGEGEWEEESLLVPGATLEQAREWGRTFGQAAVLWGQDNRAALIWIAGVGTEGVDKAEEWHWVVRAEATW